MKIIHLFILLLPFYCYGEDLCFAEIIDIALQNNPKTKQAWWNAKRMEANVGSAKSTYYPTISLNSRVSHGRDYKFINGPDTTYTNIQADLALSMMLYDFGETKAHVNCAKMALIRSEWHLNLKMQKVIVEVLECAYQYLHEDELLQASLLSLEEAKRMLEVSDKLYHAGLNPISDVYTSKSTLSLRQIEVAKRKSSVDIYRGKLATLLCLPIESELTLAPFSIPDYKTQELKSLILLAENKRGDLMEKRATLAQSHWALKKVKAHYQPKLLLGAESGYNQYIKRKESGIHYQAALNLEIPLFNGFKSFYHIQEAMTDIHMAEEEIADLEFTIALEILTFSRALESSVEMLFYANENLENAKKAYDGTFDKYEIGEESIAELSNAQKQLAEARVLYSDIKTRLLVSIANLSYATGSLCTYLD